MPRIDSISVKRGIVSAAFDDGSELRCTRSFAARLRLERGAELDAQILQRLRETAEIDVAAEIARRKSRRRAACRSDLRAALIAERLPRPAIDAALDSLAADGEIDEAGYALRHAEKRRRAGAAAALIRAELRTKGIEQADIEQAVNDEDDEQVAADWLAKSSRDEDWKRRRLRRMGFRGSLIRALLPEAAEPSASAADGNAIG